MGLVAAKTHDTTVLLASTTTAAGAIASTTGASVRLPRPINGVVFVLDVTAAATDAGDTLNVQVQTRVDDGSGETWHNVVHFPEILGNGGAKQNVEKINLQANLTGYESGSALGAGSTRPFVGDEWRVEYVQVDADANGSFTFSVTARPL